MSVERRVKASGEILFWDKRRDAVSSWLTIPLALLIGCVGSKPEIKTTESAKPVSDVIEAFVVKEHRTLTEKQETMLREFSLKESPQLWRTVQALRGEIENRNKSMAQLAADLREFGRKPENDTTYRELQIGRERIACTLDNVYQKLETAYIAYKKFQATPGREEYVDAMNRALEDGVHEAEATARRHRVMALDR